MRTSLVSISRKLAKAVDRLDFTDPVTHVYNPLRYAAAPHEQYLERYGGGPKEVVLVGMNPGPFGMAQTGVPFGEVNLVRDFLEIEAPVNPPHREHPKRPIQGFACSRSEVSGARLWGWAQRRFGSAPAFFERFFVVNYCPLLFLEASGRNRTPDKLPATEREALQQCCDAALVATLTVLEPTFAIGIGGFAHKCLQRVLGKDLDQLQLGTILHPSPASPIANRGWAPQAEQQLIALGIRLPTSRSNLGGD
ncbi:MAG: single-strand selective monofunctional uracil-DNA glycosylase [Myxococcales bacterium FL481]|nr:MAG: single-strand selective monofunctional uracil-DNA glycosylase [Myxococcales bacterium FL481]